MKEFILGALLGLAMSIFFFRGYLFNSEK